MLQITPQMKILVAVEPADLRRGIGGLVCLCKDTLGQDPFLLLIRICCIAQQCKFGSP